jgi:hypothetical protein
VGAAPGAGSVAAWSTTVQPPSCSSISYRVINGLSLCHFQFNAYRIVVNGYARPSRSPPGVLKDDERQVKYFILRRGSDCDLQRRQARPNRKKARCGSRIASARDGTKASKWEFLPTGTNHIDTTESSADRLRPSAVAADIDTLWQSALRSGGECRHAGYPVA